MSAVRRRTTRSRRSRRGRRAATPRSLLRLTVVAALGLVLGVGALFVFRSGPGSAPATPLAETNARFAPDETTVADCVPSDLACLAQAYGNLAYAEGPKVAISAVAADLRPGLPDACHRIVHRIAAAAVARDPDHPGAVLAAGSSDCGSAYYHGVLQHVLLASGATEPKAIAAAGVALCSDPAVTADRLLFANCLHGLGHGALIVADYDLPGGMTICAAISDGWSREWCYSGLYMEQALPFYLAEAAVAEDPTYPCGAIDDDQGKGSCYAFVAIRSFEAGGAAASAAACAVAEAHYRFICYASMGSQVDAATGATAIGEACATAGEYLPTCVYGSLRFLTSTTKGIVKGAVLCEDRAIGISRDLCIRAIGSGLVGIVSGPIAAEIACGEAFSDRRDRSTCLTGAVGD